METLQSENELAKMQEEDLKKIETIKEFIGQSNDDNLDHPVLLFDQIGTLSEI